MSINTNMHSDSMRSQKPKKGLGVFLAFCFALGAFASGLYLGESNFDHTQSASLFNIFTDKDEVEEVLVDRNLDEFWDVWELLEEKFANSSSTDVITEEERIQGAIDGLVDAYGDPYTVYFTPVAAESFNENISGNFSGVGMEVGLRDRLVTVIAPLPGTPAEKSGVLPGDVIVKIDDVSAEDMRIDEAVKLIRGEKGTEVILQVFREGELEFIDISIIRDTISIPTVKTEQIDDVFIVSLYSFNAVANAQMNQALKQYVESDAESLVIDLRGNPGGFLQGAVAIAGYFLPAGKIVVTEEFGDSSLNDVFRSRGNQIQIFNKENLVVLVDNGSASASEILAGALKDHEVATVIGSQTFGKGSVQELVKLDNGSSLKVTVARWLTPNGVSISQGGLTPDLVISRTPAHRLLEEDPQKDAAVDFLQGKEVVSETFEDKLAEVDSGE
jgi:carboxyl-terminal processing protease